MISSANSMKLGYSQDWSRSGYLSEVGSLDSLWVFYILGFILRSDWWMVFRILNYRSSLVTFSTFRVFFILSILAYSWRAIKYAIQLEFYCEATTSDQYCLASFKELYSMKYRRCLYFDYCSVNLWALPLVIHILIGIILVPIFSVFIFSLIEILRIKFL